MIDTNSIKVKNSLVDIVEKIGFKPKSSGGEYRCACPLHGGHDKTAFVIYDDGQRWKCFSGDCGSGDVIAFVMAWRNLGFLEAVKFLGGDKQMDPAELVRIAEERERRGAAELAEKQREYNAALANLLEARTWEHWHDDMNGVQRQMWRARGVGEYLQDFYKLGYTDTFRYSFDETFYTSPALSIPSYDEHWQITSVRMRLLEPVNEKSKYRPIRSGLPAVPFLADPGLGYNAERYLIVEGEIKAMVTWGTWERKEAQVIGIPGKENKRVMTALSNKLRGQDVTICFDPDALLPAVEFARQLGGAKVAKYGKKIDDAILQYDLTGQWIDGWLQNARYIK